MLENCPGWVFEVSGRPTVAEAARVIGLSLVGRSAPRPLLPSRGRTSGPRRLTGKPAFASPTGEGSGSGSRSLSLSKEAPMNNSVVAFNPCGIEVSHRTLVVALRGHDQD